MRTPHLCTSVLRCWISTSEDGMVDLALVTLAVDRSGFVVDLRRRLCLELSCRDFEGGGIESFRTDIPESLSSTSALLCLFIGNDPDTPLDSLLSNLSRGYVFFPGDMGSGARGDEGGLVRMTAILRRFFLATGFSIFWNDLYALLPARSRRL